MKKQIITGDVILHEGDYIRSPSNRTFKVVKKTYEASLERLYIVSLLNPNEFYKLDDMVITGWEKLPNEKSF